MRTSFVLWAKPSGDAPAAGREAPRARGGRDNA